jgi:ChaC-like protein
MACMHPCSSMLRMHASFAHRSNPAISVSITVCCFCTQLMRSLLLHLASLSALQVRSFPLAHQATQRQPTRMASDKSDSTAASSGATTGSNLVPEPVKAVWDAINGVWQGSKAARDEHDLPNPLWVFGYGSLCWKPETNWLGYVLAFCSRCNCSDFRCEQTCR